MNAIAEGFLAARVDAHLTVRCRDRSGLHEWLEPEPAIEERLWNRSEALATMAERWASRPASRSAISSYTSHVRCRPDQFDRSFDSYGSLCEFWDHGTDLAERLRTDRPAGSLIVPCDGCLQTHASTDNGALHLKGANYDLADLLPGAWAVDRRSEAVVIRVRPFDYHGVVSPLGAYIRDIVILEAGVGRVPPGGTSQYLLQRRAAIWLEAEGGDLVLVAIGGLLVRSIELLARVGSTVMAGDLLGRFHLGGSTVVLLAPAGRLLLSTDLVDGLDDGFEVEVKLGEQLGGWDDLRGDQRS